MQVVYSKLFKITGSVKKLERIATSRSFTIVSKILLLTYRYSDYKFSGDDGGLVLYRLAAELDLKRLDMERRVPADLNSFVDCRA